MITRGNQTNLFSGDLEFEFVPYENTYPTGNETTSIHLWGGVEDSGWFATMNWNSLLE